MDEQETRKELLKRLREEIFKAGYDEETGGPPTATADSEELWREETLEEQAALERAAVSESPRVNIEPAATPATGGATITADQEHTKEILKQLREELFSSGHLEDAGGSPLVKMSPEELWRKEELEEQAEQERATGS